MVQFFRFLYFIFRTENTQILTSMNEHHLNVEQKKDQRFCRIEMENSTKRNHKKIGATYKFYQKKILLIMI